MVIFNSFLYVYQAGYICWLKIHGFTCSYVESRLFHVPSLISRGCPPAPFPPLAPIAPLLPLRGTYLTVQDPWKNLRWFHRTCGLSRLSHGLKWFKTRTGWWCNNHLEKYESQWEELSHILWKIKNVPNHQPENARWRCSLFHVAMKHSGMYERMPSTICELRRTSKIMEHHCNGTRWCPPVISWFISPSNYSYKYHKP